MPFFKKTAHNRCSVALCAVLVPILTFSLGANLVTLDSGRHEIEKSCTWKISLVAAGNHLAWKENIVYTFWWLHYSKKRN